MRVAALALALVAGCAASHHHGPRAHPDDYRHLYVEIAAGGALADGARRGLAALGFTLPIEHGGDVELQPETKLAREGNATRCTVKILVLRLPQHDLLGIADGSAVAGGHAGDECAATLAATLVRGKVAILLRQQLAAKR